MRIFLFSILMAALVFGVIYHNEHQQNQPSIFDSKAEIQNGQVVITVHSPVLENGTLIEVVYIDDYNNPYTINLFHSALTVDGPAFSGPITSPTTRIYISSACIMQGGICEKLNLAKRSMVVR